nr:hypothetical protein [Tanacetum cinerariifolium]
MDTILYFEGLLPYAKVKYARTEEHKGLFTRDLYSMGRTILTSASKGIHKIPYDDYDDKQSYQSNEKFKGDIAILIKTNPLAHDLVDQLLAVETEIATGVRIVAEENVVVERPKCPRKKRQAATDASGSSHPPKKLRGGYGSSSEAVICGKSPFALRELLASSVLNVKVGVAAVPTLPMVHSSVSATLEHESGATTDSITGLNIRTIGAFERFIISLDSSRHSSTHASEAEGDSVIRSAVVPPMITETVVTSHAVNIPLVSKMGVKVTSLVRASLFQDSDSTKTMKADIAGPSYSAKQDLSMGSRELNFETLHQIRKMDYHYLFTVFNMGTACQTCLNAKVKMRTEYYLSERKRLESEYEKQANLLKVGDAEIKSLKAQLLLKETEAAKAVHLRTQIEEFQDAQMNIVNDKVEKLDADLLEMALHLEEIFYPHLLNTIAGQRWLLTHGLKLAVVKCLNSPEYLSALGAAISRAIEKGVQDGISAGIDHGNAGRSLEDVTAYNPSAEADYTFALQRIHEVDFPLLVELKSHKDASTADVMVLLRLEGPLTDAPGMSDLQPNIEQLKLPIRCLKDQVIFGETSLLVALDVTHSRVERIRENVAAQRMPVTIATTTALSVTFASASTIPSITIEDYEIVGTDGLEDAQGSGQGEAVSFLNTIEFEKEELDATPEHDPPS